MDSKPRDLDFHVRRAFLTAPGFPDHKEIGPALPFESVSSLPELILGMQGQVESGTARHAKTAAVRTICKRLVPGSRLMPSFYIAFANWSIHRKP